MGKVVITGFCPFYCGCKGYPCIFRGVAERCRRDDGGNCPYCITFSELIEKEKTNMKEEFENNYENIIDAKEVYRQIAEMSDSDIYEIFKCNRHTLAGYSPLKIQKMFDEFKKNKKENHSSGSYASLWY